MNAAIVLLAVCAAAVQVSAGPHGPHGEKMRKNMEECMASTGADPEAVKAAKHGEGPADESVKCFAACFGKKMGSINEDGTVNKDQLSQMAMHAPEEQREQMQQELQKCAEISGANDCETGFALWECIRPIMKPRHRKHRRE